MNRKPDHDDDDPLLALICELDERLEDQGQNQERSAHSQRANSIAALDASQRLELEEAEQALRFLHRMRKNLGVLRELRDDLSGDLLPDIAEADAESHPAAGDSTYRDQAGHPGDSMARLPKHLGRFEILDVLGQGGFNRVFLARDPQLDRLVALKVPRPSAIAEVASRRRFQREALAAATLSHPAIVPIYETGAFGPISYIAFGYCNGQTLAEWIAHPKRRAEPITDGDLRESARMVAKLSEAVAHAHRRGIVHRDLKPANILIESQNDEGPGKSIAGRLRITDFGLAKLEASSSESLTIDGAIVGTPAYMSPEQARGETSVGPRSDIFALGAILYELLTGHRPFQGKSHIATLRAIESAVPKPPSAWNPSIPRDLEAICLKCLAKRPEDRYPTAHDLDEDLTCFLEGRPVQARSASLLEKTLAWVRREPRIAASLTFAFVALAIGLATAMWQLSVAQHQFQRAERNLGRAQGVVEQMVSDVANKLQYVPELKQLRSSLVAQAVALQEEMLAEERHEPAVILKTAQAYHWQALYLSEFGDATAALEVCQQGMDLLSELPAEFAAPERSSLERELKLFKSRALSRADDKTDKVENILPSTNLPMDELEDEQLLQLARTKYQAGNLKLRDGDYEHAIRIYREGLDIAELLPATQHRVATVVVYLHTWIGQCQIQLGDTAGARQSATEAQRIVEAQLDSTPDHPAWLNHTSNNHVLKARAFERDDDSVAAALEFSKARGITERLVRQFPKKNDYLYQYIYTSVSLSTALKHADTMYASVVLKQLLDFLEAMDPQYTNQPGIAINVAKAHSNLAQLLHNDEDYDAAVEHHLQSQALYEELLASVDSSDRRLGLAWALEMFAETLVAIEQYERARAICELAIEHYLASGQIENNANEASNLTDVFCVLNEIDCAQRDYATATQTVTRLLEHLPEKRLAAAALCAEAANAIGKDEALAVVHRQQLRSKFLDRSAKLLLEYSDGQVDIEKLQDIIAFRPLLEDNQFRAMIGLDE